MHSGYGVSEMQQHQHFVQVDGICTPFFPTVAATATATAAATHAPDMPHTAQHHHQQYRYFHQLQSQLHFQEERNSVDPLPPQHPRFPPHFQHQIPITQHLFQQSHQFHLFRQQQQTRLLHQHQQQHHLGLEHDTQQTDTSSSPPRIDLGVVNNGGIPAFLLPAINFRLSVNEKYSTAGTPGGGRDGLNDDDAILHGDEVDGSESLWPPPPHQPTSTGDDTAVIKEPFWTPLDLDLDLDLDFMNRNNKSCKEKNHRREEEESGFKRFKETKQPTNVDAEDGGTNDGRNYKLFSELEAICKPGGNAIINNNQTGSSSALTGENQPPITLVEPSPIDHQMNMIPTSDTSTGEEASLKKGTHCNDGNRNGNKREMKKEKRQRRRKEQLCSIATFFETLVKQLMDNQESLHQRFLQVLEKRDQERIVMEEAWRQQETTKSTREAIEREEQLAVATARESVIVTFIEKITGESLNLPTKPQFQSNPQQDNNSNDGGQRAGVVGTNRWPKAEVQALIRVRSGLETRFQEPGLKGPVWEEVSSAMAAMGYHRNAKRCKEKWENINKYFRKAKESTKKRPQYSKTCPYFHLLDQLYSKTSPAGTTGTAAATPTMDRLRGNSELLDAIVLVSNDHSGFQYPPDNKYSANTNNIDDDLNVSAGTTCKEKDDEEEEEDEEEGESLSSAPTTKSQHHEETFCLC